MLLLILADLAFHAILAFLRVLQEIFS